MTLYNLLGYIIAEDPHSTLLVYPSDEEGRTVSRTRLKPLIEASPVLREKLPRTPKGYTLSEVPFPGMVLYIVGSNSPTPLSQKPCRNIIRDECNKFPAHIPGHGDPMDLSAERFKSFWDIRKVIDVSSPTTDNGNICRQEALCQVILRYFVPCPFCHRLQTLEWEQIDFDYRKELDRVSRIHVAKESARFKCKFCGELIDDVHKEWMLSPESGAGWRDMTIEEPTVSPDPIADLFQDFRDKGVRLESVAFRLSSIYSPWLRWGDIVGKFLEANLSESRRYDKLRAFRTDWLGEPWRDVVEEKKESDILKLRGELPPLVVPKEALILTMGIDCQKVGFWFTVWAWERDYTSHLVRYGFVLTWDDVRRLIFEDSYEVAGTSQRKSVYRVGIDIGGGDVEGDRSMTQQAYEFISTARSGGIFGVKGSSREMDQKMKLSLIDSMPGKQGSAMPGAGVRLFVIDTGYFKDVFHYRTQIKEGDPGCIYLHNETGEDFAKQITAEEKRRDPKGRYTWEKTRADNHLLDATIYASALADSACFGGLAVIRDPQQEQREKPKAEKARHVHRPSMETSGSTGVPLFDTAGGCDVHGHPRGPGREGAGHLTVNPNTRQGSHEKGQEGRQEGQGAGQGV